jgi:hypothetical protein
MKRRGTYSTVLLIPALLLPAPSYSSIAPPAYRIGITRVGFVDRQGQAAFDRLEKRLQRWAENEPGLGVRATPLAAVDRSALSGNLAGWENALLALYVSPVVSSAHRSAQTLLSEALTTLAGARDFGPLRQRILLARAVVGWRAGEQSWRRLWAEAVAISPEGSLAEAAFPSAFSGAERMRFLEATQGVAVEDTRGCSIDLDITPAQTTVSLDGFALGARRHFELVRGRDYRAWLRAEGYASRELVLDCRRAGQWIETARLERGHDLEERSVVGLRFLTESEGLPSVVFARPIAADRFGLFLYTPGVGMDAVPTESPLTFASLNESPVDARMPIVSDVFSDLIARHRAGPFRIQLAQSGEPGYVTSATLPAAPADPAWYERKRFWWIVGGVGAGVAAAFLIGAAQRQQTPAGNGFSMRVD